MNSIRNERFPAVLSPSSCKSALHYQSIPYCLNIIKPVTFSVLYLWERQQQKLTVFHISLFPVAECLFHSCSLFYAWEREMSHCFTCSSLESLLWKSWQKPSWTNFVEQKKFTQSHCAFVTRKMLGLKTFIVARSNCRGLKLHCPKAIALCNWWRQMVACLEMFSKFHLRRARPPVILSLSAFRKITIDPLFRDFNYPISQ